MTSITFTVPGVPVPWARARRKRGQYFTAKEQSGAMQGIGLFARRAMGNKPLFEGPLFMMLDAVYPWPASITKKRKASIFGHYKETRPDLDNLVKLVKDALNGVVYRDDAQICKTVASKYYAESGRLTVTIQSLQDIATQEVRAAA